MFMTNQLSGFASTRARDRAVCDYRTATFQNNGTNYTFSAQDVGDMVGGGYRSRHVVVFVYGGTAGAISSVTVGGVTCTTVLEEAGGDGGVYIAEYSNSNTTADIVINRTSATDHMGIGVYALYNLRSATPYDSEEVTAWDTGSPTFNVDVDIVVPHNGVLLVHFAVPRSAGSGRAILTNTGGVLTEDFDQKNNSTGGDTAHAGYHFENIGGVTGPTAAQVDSDRDGSGGSLWVWSASWR